MSDVANLAEAIVPCPGYNLQEYKAAFAFRMQEEVPCAAANWWPECAPSVP
jgi:hypothetical protein